MNREANKDKKKDLCEYKNPVETQKHRLATNEGTITNSLILAMITNIKHQTLRGKRFKQ